MTQKSSHGRTEKLTKVFTISILLFASACVSAGIPSWPYIYREPEEVLEELNVDEKSFSHLSACEQVHVFFIVGLFSLDIDHAIPIVPEWMDETINRIPSNTLIECVEIEAYQRIDSLSSSSNPERDSLAVHALLYKVWNLRIADDERILQIFHRAVCEEKVRYSGRLVFMYYLSRYGESPSNPGEEEIGNMIRDGLCSSAP